MQQHQVWNRLSDIVPRDSSRVTLPTPCNTDLATGFVVKQILDKLRHGEGGRLKTRDNVWISLMDRPDEAASSLLFHSVI